MGEATSGLRPASASPKITTCNVALFHQRCRCTSYRTSAPKLAAWLEENAPEGLAVFTLPEQHRRRLRTSNPMERSVQQELKRRTVKVRVFPSDDALLRLVSAVLVEIDEKWAAETKAYIKWECQDA